MPVLTASFEPVDVSDAALLFKGRVSQDQLERPWGQVDLLIGIPLASLHPVPEARLGNLLSSAFGSGWLLDGSHQSVQASGFYMTEEVVRVSHAARSPPHIIRTNPLHCAFCQANHVQYQGQILIPGV